MIKGEGEFKKRIDLVFPSENGIYIKSQLDESKNILLASLEDAKKDVLSDFETQFPNPDGQFMLIKKSTFKKWFGSPETPR